MDQTAVRIETAYDFLQRKGISKVHQPSKRYNLTVAELVDFLNEFAEISTQEYEGSELSAGALNFHYGTNNDIVI